MPKVPQSVVDQHTRRYKGPQPGSEGTRQRRRRPRHRDQPRRLRLRYSRRQNLTGRPSRSFHDFASAYRNTWQARMPARILLTRPDNRTGTQRGTAGWLASACPDMKALDSLTGSFAALLAPARGTGRSSSSGSTTREPPTCLTCTLSPGASNSTSRPPPPRSRSRTTTAARKASTRRPKRSKGHVRARRLRPPPPHPARIRARIVTTGTATEPLRKYLLTVLCGRASGGRLSGVAGRACGHGRGS
jgi:hypothetical protein